MPLTPYGSLLSDFTILGYRLTLSSPPPSVVPLSVVPPPPCWVLSVLPPPPSVWLPPPPVVWLPPPDGLSLPVSSGFPGFTGFPGFSVAGAARLMSLIVVSRFSVLSSPVALALNFNPRMYFATLKSSLVGAPPFTFSPREKMAMSANFTFLPKRSNSLVQAAASVSQGTCFRWLLSHFFYRSVPCMKNFLLYIS